MPDCFGGGLEGELLPRGGLGQAGAHGGSNKEDSVLHGDKRPDRRVN